LASIASLHSEYLSSKLAIWIHVIGSVEIKGVDLLAANELCQIDDL
jgi:hypothetical protein